MNKPAPMVRIDAGHGLANNRLRLNTQASAFHAAPNPKSETGLAAGDMRLPWSDSALGEMVAVGMLSEPKPGAKGSRATAGSAETPASRVQAVATASSTAPVSDGWLRRSQAVRRPRSLRGDSRTMPDCSGFTKGQMG